jgi:NitT/TauT family transport system permease protein
MRRLAEIAAPLALVAALLVLWEVACRALDVPVYFLPPPSAIGRALVAGAGPLVGSALNTLTMALSALALAAAVALPLALATGVSRTLERALSPIAVALQVTPVVAVAPLAVIWAGLDHPERAIVGLAAVVAFFPLFSGALTGLKSADPDLERLFDLYGASRPQRLFRLRVPAATPFVLEGLKVAAGLSVIGAVVAEFVAGTGAALAVLGLLGAVLHGVLGAAERRVLRAWRGSGR